MTKELKDKYLKEEIELVKDYSVVESFKFVSLTEGNPFENLICYLPVLRELVKGEEKKKKKENLDKIKFLKKNRKS